MISGPLLLPPFLPIPLEGKRNCLERMLFEASEDFRSNCPYFVNTGAVKKQDATAMQSD